MVFCFIPEENKPTANRAASFFLFDMAGARCLFGAAPAPSSTYATPRAMQIAIVSQRTCTATTNHAHHAAHETLLGCTVLSRLSAHGRARWTRPNKMFSKHNKDLVGASGAGSELTPPRGQGERGRCGPAARGALQAGCPHWTWVGVRAGIATGMVAKP